MCIYFEIVVKCGFLLLGAIKESELFHFLEVEFNTYEQKLFRALDEGSQKYPDWYCLYLFFIF
jgi:hypothetical protein